MRKSIVHIVLRFGFICVFSGLAIAGTPAKETGHNTKSSFDQDIQVSIEGSPVSSGHLQDFGAVNLLSTSSAITVTIENAGTPEDLTGDCSQF